jgi:hypothetical protein
MEPQYDWKGDLAFYKPLEDVSVMCDCLLIDCSFWYCQVLNWQWQLPEQLLPLKKKM